MKKAPLHLTFSAISIAAAGISTREASAAGMDVLPGTIISSLPYVDTGSTIGLNNDINEHPGAPIFNGYSSAAAPDVFWSFTVATTGTVNISYSLGASGSSTEDAVLGVFTGTIASPNWIIGSDNEWSATGNNPETVSFTVLAGQTYHILGDGYFGDSAGNYTLNVTGTAILAPVPEPGAAGLLVVGAAAAAGWRRRRRGVA